MRPLAIVVSDEFILVLDFRRHPAQDLKIRRICEREYEFARDRCATSLYWRYHDSDKVIAPLRGTVEIARTLKALSSGNSWQM